MGSISMLQWHKAYMLEFLEGKELKECFTFSVPPESEEFGFAQRVTETKTFGGSVFDDYGNDTYKITINGTTINEEKKLVYKGSVGAPLFLTGTKEIFELQRIIKDWAANKNISNITNKKVYLYDLSKMSVLQLATGVASRNYWRVFIKDLKIKRDKSRPKTFKYTLDMVAVEDEAQGTNGFFSDGISKAVAGIQTAMDSLSTVMEYTEATMTAAANVADYCRKVKLAFDMAANRKYDMGLVTLAVGNAADTVSRVLGGDSNSVYNSAKEMFHATTVFGGLTKDNSDIGQQGKIQNSNKFYVTFNSNGGSEVKREEVEYGQTAEEPFDPVKTDYYFGGWFSDSALTVEYDFSQEVTASMTLYAKWEISVATITFNSRSGSQVAPIKVDAGETATEPTPPTRNGYAFDGWYTDSACTQAFDWSSPVNDNITLYAGWVKTYNIVFNSLGGSAVDMQTVTDGGLAIYPMTPTKENYTFAYWCTDNELQNIFDFATPIHTDVALYACWVQISNTVSFNSMGGSAVDSQRVAIGGYATKPADPAKEGFDFVYWATDSAGTNEFRFNTTQITANTTLYAKWTETICEVTFDSDDGSAVETQNVGYGKKAIFPEIPSKTGYSFEMWQTRKVIGSNGMNEPEYEYEEFDFATPIIEDTELFAKWFGGGN